MEEIIRRVKSAGGVNPVAPVIDKLLEEGGILNVMDDELYYLYDGEFEDMYREQLMESVCYWEVHFNNKDDYARYLIKNALEEIRLTDESVAVLMNDDELEFVDDIDASEYLQIIKCPMGFKPNAVQYNSVCSYDFYKCISEDENGLTTEKYLVISKTAGISVRTKIYPSNIMIYVDKKNYERNDYEHYHFTIDTDQFYPDDEEELDEWIADYVLDRILFTVPLDDDSIKKIILTCKIDIGPRVGIMNRPEL